MSEYATLLACYRSGQIPEAAWQEHLKDEGLRAYVEGQRVEVRLDPKALEAAAKAIRNDIWQSEPNPTTERYVADLRQQAMDQAEAALRAYLSAAVPADVAGLVERLGAFAAGCRGSMWQSRDETIRLCEQASALIREMSGALNEAAVTFGMISNHIDEHSFSLAKGLCSQGEFAARALLNRRAEG